MKKKVFLGIIIIAILCTSCGSRVKPVTKLKIFNTLSDSDVLYRENEDSVKFDNYTINLQKSWYDSATGIGYAVLEIERENEPYTKDNATKMNIQANGISMDGRLFSMMLDTPETYGEVKDGKLYIYTQLRSTEYNRIDIKDSKSDFSYDFVLGDRTDTKKYIIDEDAFVYVSSLGIAIYSKKELNDIDLSMVVGGDKITCLNQQERDYYGYFQSGGGDGWHKYTIEFRKKINLEDVQQVIYKGEEIRSAEDEK